MTTMHPQLKTGPADLKWIGLGIVFLIGLLALTGCANQRDLVRESERREAGDRLAAKADAATNARIDQLMDRLNKAFEETRKMVIGNDQILAAEINELKPKPPKSAPARPKAPARAALPTLGGAAK